MGEAFFRRAYERAPHRFAVLVTIGAIPFSLLATTFALLTFNVAYSGSGRQLTTLIVAGFVMAISSILVTYVISWKFLRPAFMWLRGNHDEEHTIAAWIVLNDMLRVVRRGFVVFVIGNIPLSIYSIHVMDLSPWALLGIWLGALISISWGAVMITLWFDIALRPALEEAATLLPATFEPPSASVSARRKLLIASTVFATANIAIVGGLSFGLDVEPIVAMPVFACFAFLASLTVARVGNAFAARSMFEPVRTLITASDAVRSGDLTTHVPVLSGDEFGQLAHSFNRMVRGLAEREVLHSALGSYVDPRVAERLLTEGELLDGVYVDVTVLFLDLRGFTSRAEVQDAADTVTYLNDLFAKLVPLVAERGGHVNKFTGDGLLAVFGTPEYHDDHADRALSAARAIAEVMWEQGDHGFGIGVNSGKVVAGTIGGGGHLEFAVIGDAVNVASRVEGLTKETGDTVLVTGATKARLNGGPHRLIERGEHVLRGRTEAVDVYALELL